MHISPTNLYLEGTFLNIKPQLQNFNKYSTDDPQNKTPSYKFWTHSVGGYFYFLLIHQHFGFAGYSAGIGVHHENDVECQIQ